MNSQRKLQSPQYFLFLVEVVLKCLQSERHSFSAVLCDCSHVKERILMYFLDDIILTSGATEQSILTALVELVDLLNIKLGQEQPLSCKFL